MIRRNAGLAALLAVTAYTQAEIAAPPAIGENPAPTAPAPSMEEHASAPAKATSLSDKVDSSTIPSPIPFDSLESEIEEDLAEFLEGHDRYSFPALRARSSGDSKMPRLALSITPSVNSRTCAT